MDTDPSSKAFYHKFLSEAPFKGLKDGTAWSMPQDIPWFDSERYERGRKYMKEYILLVLSGFALSGMVVPGVKPPAKVFYLAGDFTPKYRYHWRRTPRLFTPVINMLFGDILKPSGIGIKAARITKAAHFRVKEGKDYVELPQNVPEEYQILAERIKENVRMVDTSALSDAAVDWEADPLSQFYFSINYFSYYCMLWIHPSISSSLPNEVKDNITYVYAVWARLMPGLRDEYNIALHQDEGMIKKLFSTFFGKVLSSLDPITTMFLYKSFREVQSLTLGILNANALLAFVIRDVAGETNDEIKFLGELSRREKWMLKYYDNFLSLYVRNSVFRTGVNWVIGILLWILKYVSPLLIRFQEKTG